MRGTWAAVSALAFAAVAFSATPSLANEDARLLIQQLGERTIAAIKLEDKVARRLQLIADGALVMDYRAIAKSVLDHAGAKVSATREIEVTEAVILYVSHQIITKVESVRPDKAEITKVEERSPDTVLVSMALVGPQDSIVAIWTVKLTSSGWHVADLSASGYSLSQHFGQLLSRHARTMDQLLLYLKEHSPLKRDNLTATP